MKVESIMTSKVKTVEMDDFIKTIREIFDEYHFHHLLVVEGKKLMGVISDRDYLRAVSPFLGTLTEGPQDFGSLNKKTHQIMSRRLVTIAKETPIRTAAEILIENDVSCLPVVSPEGNLEGIVSWKDILDFYLKNSKLG